MAILFGYDASGNGNNWTVNNLSNTAGAGNDSLTDTPTSYGTDTGVGGEVRGNYCTWNRLQTSSSITLNNGNLDAIISGGFLIYSAAGTVEVATGKWYYETVVTAGYSTNYPLIGVCDLTQITSAINTSFYSTAGGGDSTGIIARGKTNVYLSNNTTTSDGVTYNYTSDVIMIAFDADLGKVWFGKNGTWNNSSNPATNTGGHTFSTVSGKGYRPYVQCNADTSNAWTSNFGQRAFAYTAPSGFKALCTQNLPTPTIGATSTTQAGKYFNPVLYTGNGVNQASGGQAISGVGFQPDLLWLKSRGTANNHILTDAVRGIGVSLSTDATVAEYNTSDDVLSFNTNGFTVASDGTNIVNGLSVSYVAWNWNAGGSTVTNTSGTISAQVRANTTSGFSIVTYTGNGTTGATFGHGLGVTPSMIIIKKRSTGTAGNWIVYHTSTGINQYLYLNSTATAATSSPTWGVSSTLVTLQQPFNDYNTSTAPYVAYCFAPVAGYSAFGSYTGNGSSDGTFVYTGFRPRYLLLKVSSTTSSWFVYDSARDTYNIVSYSLNPNSSDAEGNTGVLDFVSNGLKLRNSGASFNVNGNTVIYAAFAESPFKYALAR